jgi:hypothetical protein
MDMFTNDTSMHVKYETNNCSHTTKYKLNLWSNSIMSVYAGMKGFLTPL